MIEFDESGMKFAFPDETTFHIETSEHYSKVNGKGVQSVECITLKNGRVLVIEAKKSVPKSKEPEIELFWQNIRRKNVDSLMIIFREIWWAETTEIGSKLLSAINDKPKFVFVLVVNGLSKDVCNGLTEIYRKKIRDVLGIFCAEAIVINEEQAAKRGIIKQYD